MPANIDLGYCAKCYCAKCFLNEVKPEFINESLAKLKIACPSCSHEHSILFENHDEDEPDGSFDGESVNTYDLSALAPLLTYQLKTQENVAYYLSISAYDSNVCEGDGIKKIREKVSCPATPEQDDPERLA